MTVRSIQIYPTCDIHLLLEGPGAPTTYQLEVRDANPPNENLSAIVERTSYTEDDPAIATVSSTGLITPIAVGETLCRVRHTDIVIDPTPEFIVSEIFVRIRVHQRLSELRFGNNRATLFKDENNYVLSVYGVFDDGTIGDISSHPYLTFDSLTPSIVQVNSTDDRGRLTGREVTGGTPVQISVIHGTLSDEVDVFVLPSLSTPRPILERIHGAGPVSERRNLLFLSEGFTAAQRPLFRRIVTLIKDEFFASHLNSPYSELKDRFNVWMAFEPSAEQGVLGGDFMMTTGTGSLGVDIATPLSNMDNDPVVPGNFTLRQLVLRVGLPDRYHPIPTTQVDAEARWASTVGTNVDPAKAEGDVVAQWLTLKDYYLLQAKDSIFGLMNGGRYGDRFSNRVDPTAAQLSPMQWYLPSRPHLVTSDRRRLARSWSARDSRNKYVASLRPSNNDASVKDVWLIPNGADRNLVVFLVNSAFDGAARTGIGLGISLRQNVRYSEVFRSGREADHGVPEIEVLSFPDLLGSSLDHLVSTFAHELSHAFTLADEYEGQGLAGTHDALRIDDNATRTGIERVPNLVHHFAIAKAPGQHGIIDIKRVKWSLWHRIVLCSVLTEDPVLLGGGRMRVRLRPGDRVKWDTPNIHNIEVFLRKRNINQPAPLPTDPATRWLEGPLKILEFEPDGSFILATTSAPIFKRGDLLYQPELADNKPLTVFHPNVLFDLETIEEPFDMKTDPSKPNLGPSYPPEHALVPDFKPRHAAYVVGLYEGGGTFNTRVYRPSGLCKMRSTRRSIVKEKPLEIDDDGELMVGLEREVKRFVPFCYVCRYSLANTLDPVLLERLPYPE
jgi:hypothetical protein